VLLCRALSHAQCPVVTTAADAVSPVPSGSLRDCLLQANASPAPDVITFDPAVFAPAEIRLVAALPALTDPGGLRIDGASRVVIDGRDVPDVSGFDVQGVVEVRGVTIQGFRGAGYGAGTAVFVRNDARLSIERSVIRGNSGGGILFQGTGSGHRIADNLITGNDIAGVRWYGPGTPCHAPRSVITRNVFRENNPAGLSADDVFVSFQGCLDVTDNRFEGNRFFGLRVAGGTTDLLVARNEFQGAPVGVFAGSRDNVFRDNLFEHDAGQGIAIGDGQGSTNNRVVGNVFRTGAADVGLYVYDRSSTTRVFHNTFVGYRGAAVQVDGLQVVEVRNNLFVDSDAGVLGPVGAGSIIDTNGVFGVTTACVSCDAGAVVEGAPGFVNAPTDLRLTPCVALAIDRGVDLGVEQPARGADGGPFNGLAPDLGAFEAAACPGGDAGVVDAGLADAGSLGDAGVEPLDGGPGDAGHADAGLLDAGARSMEPRGPPPTSVFSVGCGCGGVPAGALCWILWCVLAVRRARRT
jgi:nitrous oxidase accessory protein NosD